MKLMLGAAVAGALAILAGNANAATILSETFTPPVGQITTYTFSSAGYVSGEVEIQGSYNRMFRWWSPNDAGGVDWYTQSDPDGFGLGCDLADGNCSQTYSSGGSFKLSVYRKGQALVIRADNRLFDFDHCDEQFSSGTCSYRFDPIKLYVDGVAYGADDVNFTVSSTAVPEPATWAMMIAGFGLVGTSMRRRRPLATA